MAYLKLLRGRKAHRKPKHTLIAEHFDAGSVAELFDVCLCCVCTWFVLLLGGKPQCLILTLDMKPS